MTRASILLLLAPSALLAAPVPKELQHNASPVGVWRQVAHDPLHRWIPSGPYYWVIDADGGLSIGITPNCGELKPTEFLVFDAKTGFVEKRFAAVYERTLLGRYELKGDILTICMDVNGKTRPKSIHNEDYNIWHLRRAKENK